MFTILKDWRVKLTVMSHRGWGRLIAYVCPVKTVSSLWWHKSPVVGPRMCQCAGSRAGSLLSWSKPVWSIPARASAHVFLDRLMCIGPMAASCMWACVTSSISTAEVGHFLELLLRMERAFPWLSVISGIYKLRFSVGPVAPDPLVKSRRCWKSVSVPNISKVEILLWGVCLSKIHGSVCLDTVELNHQTWDFLGDVLLVIHPPMLACSSSADASDEPHHSDIGDHGEMCLYGVASKSRNMRAMDLTSWLGLPEVCTAWNPHLD